MIESIWELWAWAHNMPIILLIGMLALVGFYSGRGIRFFRLPSIVAYMLVGIGLGPSVTNFITYDVQDQLSFLVQITLAFVALSIGLELNLKSLRDLGGSVIWVILIETFGAALVVTGVIYLVTGNVPLALIFGAIAPASAPAGTVAVIRETNAKGPLTKTLYAVVGFDDGLTIIIFGFAAALARNLLVSDVQISIWINLWYSFKEILMVIVIGTLMSYVFSYCVKQLEKPQNMLILTFCFVLITVGLTSVLHISMILTNMMLGFMMSNTQPKKVLERIELRLSVIMPLLFILFFSLAGASLHLNQLTSLGMIGAAYVVSRTFGLMGGAWLGAVIGKASQNIKKYVGMGILSQAGVAIGLSLIIKHEFHGLGALVQGVGGGLVPLGTYIGEIVITTVTATSVLFELVGPILTRIALKRAGEIPSTP